MPLTSAPSAASRFLIDIAISIPRYPTASLLGLDIQFLHQPPILLDISAKEPVGLLGSAADRLQRLLFQVLTDRRGSEHLVDLGVEASSDRLRRGGRSEYADPLVKHQPLEARLFECRHLRKARRARRS